MPNYTIDSIKSYSNNLVMRSPEGKTFGISLWEWKTELENYLNEEIPLNSCGTIDYEIPFFNKEVILVNT